jgi:serine/threonine protein kinase
MKLYAGSLADLLKDGGPLPPPRVLDLGAQVAAALAELHGLSPGIAIFDLKPNNLLLDGDLDQVRKTQSWPRSWANFSRL